MNNLILSVDLDDWYHSALVSGTEWSRFPSISDFYLNWKERYDYVTEPTKRLLNVFAKYNIKATFFMIADMVERYPELVKLLKNSQHEIAHHSYDHSVPFNTETKDLNVSKDLWESELIKGKEILERTFLKEIIGYRAPNAYFADWMIPILLRNKFKYDSSFAYNSLFNKTNLDLSIYPRNIFKMDNNAAVTNQSNAILEIPWPYLKFMNFAFPGGGAYFFRLFGYNYFKTLINQTLKTGDTIFYIHSLDVSDEKFPLTNFKKRPFYWINKGTKTLNKLEKLIYNYKEVISSCDDVVKKYE